MIIPVVVGNNVKREEIPVDTSETLKSALESQGIDYTKGITNLDGSPLGPGDLNKTFDQFGVTAKCYLLNVVKADNA